MTETFFYDKRQGDRWLNPIALAELQRAVKKRAKTVVLNGVQFNLNYDQSWVSEYTGKHDLVRIKRSDGGFVPFAYINLERILKYDFETSDA